MIMRAINISTFNVQPQSVQEKNSTEQKRLLKSSNELVINEMRGPRLNRTYGKYFFNNACCLSSSPADIIQPYRIGTCSRSNDTKPRIHIFYRERHPTTWITIIPPLVTFRQPYPAHSLIIIIILINSCKSGNAYQTLPSTSHTHTELHKSQAVLFESSIHC